MVRITLPTPFMAGPVNAFLVKSTPPILVDTGARMADAHERLIDRLHENGVAPRDLGAIFLTHGHLDHAGMLAEVIEDSGAPAYAHPYVVEQYADYDKGTQEGLEFLTRVMHRAGVPKELADLFLAARAQFSALGSNVAIDHPLEDEQEVLGFKACFVPGHSAGDVVFYHPEHRIAFLGDHVLRNVSATPLIRKPRRGAAQPKWLVEYRDSLLRTRALPIETCYAGHGAPFTGHQAIIDDLLDRYDRHTEALRAILATGAFTAYGLVTALFPKLDIKVLHFGISLALGHLELLLESGEATLEERDGIAYYSLKK